MNAATSAPCGALEAATRLPSKPAWRTTSLMMVPGVDRWQIEHFQYIQIHVVIGKLQSQGIPRTIPWVLVHGFIVDDFELASRMSKQLQQLLCLFQRRYCSLF